MLTQRHQDILKRVVEQYIRGGEPVGSKALRERTGLDLSAASIRNAMLELTLEGYLSQLHTSAGRVPTTKGYRIYAESLRDRQDLSREARERILGACDRGAGDLDRTLDRTSREVADLARQACLVLPPNFDHAPLQEIRFLPIAGNGRGSRNILVLLVSRAGQIQNRIIALEETHSQEELDAFGTSLTRRLGGMTLGQIRQRLAREEEEHLRDYRELREKLLAAVSSGSWFGDHLIVSGHNNLLQGADAAATPRLVALMEALVEKRRLIALLDKCLEAEGVQVFIGSEATLDPQEECTMVAAKFSGPEGRPGGTLGVLGPARLDYSFIIPLVEFAARTLSGRLGGSQDTGRTARS
ncbi:MAG: heat-inducible transcription repressor HrcA [Magnetococcales bacterium]|nr:heat-inducible transcription repressor HrcA [Magnetococcales bacterium]